MKARAAIRAGVRRGWTEFLLSLRSSQDQTFYLFGSLVTLVVLFFYRSTPVEGIEGLDMTMAQALVPTIIGVAVAFGLIVGPAYTIAMEKEDGTVLRMKSAPHGIGAYVTGQVWFNLLGMTPMFVTIMVPSIVFFDVVSFQGAMGWVMFVCFVLLGSLAVLPVGIAIGCLVPDTRRVTTWGMLPVGAMVAISGIFVPVTQLWGWVQGVAQALPLYWLGQGLRWSLLPDGFQAAEVGGEWNIGTGVAVLVAWAVIGTLVATKALRVATSRQSGSAIERARDEAVNAYVR